MTNSVKSLITQEYTDNIIEKLFFQSEIDAHELINALDRLNSIAAQNGLHSIYIYNGLTKVFYSSTSGMRISKNFDDQEVVKILSNPEKITNFIPIPRKILKYSNYGDYMQSSNVYTYFFNEMDKSRNSLNFSIIVNVSDLWIRNSIDALNKSQTGKVLVIDNSGKIVNGTVPGNMLSDISKLSFVRQILGSKSNSGYFIDNVDGEKSLISYVTSDSTDWKFIMYTPYSIILNQLAGMTFKTVLICFSILLIGLFIAFIISKKIYKPVKGILDKLDSQYELASHGASRLKQEFLSHLLLSENLISAETIGSGFSSFKSKLEKEKPILLVLLRIDYYSDFKAKYNHKDRTLFKFGILNIAAEMLEALAPSETIDLDSDHVVLLLNTEKQPTGETKKLLSSIISDIQDSVLKYLDISVTAAVSFGANITKLNFSYTETMNITSLRMFEGSRAVFFLDSDNCLPYEDYWYPAQKEKLLSESIVQGKFADAEKYCFEILDSTSRYAYSTTMTTILRLFFANVMAINTLAASRELVYSFNFNEFYMELTNLEFMDDIKSKFSSLYSYISEKQIDKKNNKYNELISKVDEIIKSNYMRDDLCPDSIADAQGLSPIYLGRLYKKYTSKSVGEYITEIRLQKAAELLMNTNQNISDIAKNTGFSSTSYFGVLFKKVHGITPNEYRQKTRKS